jgi:hypothetical protein
VPGRWRRRPAAVRDVKIAVMQPYLLPYIGYFQLIGAVDRFVVYDNIKYTKKGWINRNRMLVNGAPGTFTVPLRQDSDRLDVRERHLAEDFNRDKLLHQIEGAYRRAPRFDDAFALIERVIRFEGENLFAFLHHSLVQTCGYLGIRTPLIVSSTLPVDHSLRAADRVIAICRHEGASIYVNPIGGTELYSPEAFARQGVALRFLRTRELQYRQFGAPFVPWLSIMDVLMFNPLATVREWLTTYFDLLTGPGPG